MTVEKYHQARTSIINQKPFLSTSWLVVVGIIIYIAFGVYGFSLTEALLAFLPMALTSSVVIGISSAVFWDEEDYLLGYKNTIETPTGQNLLSSFKESSQLKRILFYSPSSGLVVEPLSIRNLAHVLTYKLPSVFLIFLLALLAFGIVKNPYSGGFLELLQVLLTSVIAYIAANFLIYIAINAINLTRILSNKNTLKYDLICTSYTEQSLEEDIMSLGVWFGKEAEGEKNILWLLNNQCYDIARRINNLVVSGFIDDGLVEKEKEFIEYSLNRFIPLRINDVKEFLSNQDDFDLARKAFEETGKEKLEKAIYTMLDKADNITKALDQIEANIERIRLDAIKSQIEDKDWAGTSDSGAVIGYVSPYFQEYHLLKFPNLESKVVADNIIKKTLPKLVEQEKQAENMEDLNLIREQINSTKQFVKSIAEGTDESEQRRQRIEQKEEKNPLALENPSINNSVRNLALANQRYLEALDKSLPAE